MGQIVVIEEDFESYAVGDPIASVAGPPWTTWSGATGTAEDALVSSEQANSGTKSLKIVGSAAGGPIDQVLRLGDRTSGAYDLSWYMYIPAGSGAYFNLQHNEVIGTGSWMLDVTFDPNGTIEYAVDTTIEVGTFTSDIWFMVDMHIDMDAGTGTLSIDGTEQYDWLTGTPGPDQLGAVNFFAYAGGTAIPTYYLDDVSFVQEGNVGVPEVLTSGLSVYPNPANEIITVELRSNSGNAIVSVLDLTGRTVREGVQFQQNGPQALTRISLRDLPGGIYLVRVQDGGEVLVHRIVKE
jgi:hypothetical protein